MLSNSISDTTINTKPDIRLTNGFASSGNMLHTPIIPSNTNIRITDDAPNIQNNPMKNNIPMNSKLSPPFKIGMRNESAPRLVVLSIFFFSEFFNLTNQPADSDLIW